MTTSKDKILSALVYLHDVLQIDEPTKDRVVKMSGVKPSTFTPLVSRMVKKGVVAYGKTQGTLTITMSGRREAPEGEFALPTSNEEHQRQILEKLSGKPKRIFEILMDGEAHTKSSIMDAIGCTNVKTFSPLLSRHLAKAGYIEYVGGASIKLSSECYPMGM